MVITKFMDEYFFLSNFYPHLFTVKGVEYKTNEHFFQSKKCQEEDVLKQLILDAKDPGVAKEYGRKVELHEDWEQLKAYFMYIGLCNKFKDPELKMKLLGTGNNVLVEGNNWCDNTWGKCSCKCCSKKHINGKNWLGNLLMELREELKD